MVSLTMCVVVSYTLMCLFSLPHNYVIGSPTVGRTDNTIYKHNFVGNGSSENSFSYVRPENTTNETQLIFKSLKRNVTDIENFWSILWKWLANATMERSAIPIPTQNVSKIQARRSPNISEDIAIDNTLPTHPPSHFEYHVEHPHQSATLDGLRFESEDKPVYYEDNGAAVILADVHTSIRLFGKDFTKNTVVKFTNESNSQGAACSEDTPSTKLYSVLVSKNGGSALIENVMFSASHGKYFYICIREVNGEKNTPWTHQGSEPWLTIKANRRILPVVIQIAVIIMLLLMSGLFAGLTLGLLALGTTDLQVVINVGNEVERSHASKILPLREKGNYLLCSLVLGNVLVNSILTILLDDLTTGWIAVISATAGIVMFGEIIPQAVCSRNGLEIGAKTVWVTKVLMVITFPLSYIISFFLDKVLGEEIGKEYNVEKLMEFVKVTMEKTKVISEEAKIICGTLSIKNKSVDCTKQYLSNFLAITNGNSAVLSDFISSLYLENINSKRYEYEVFSNDI